MHENSEPVYTLSADVVAFCKEAIPRLGMLAPKDAFMGGLVIAHGLVCLGASIEAGAKRIADALNKEG